MSENVITSALVENCERFSEKASSLAKEQSIAVNNRAVFLQSLIETTISCVATASRKNEDMSSANELISNLLQVEIKKFVDEKAMFDQTLGKVVTTNEVVNYIKSKISQEKSKKEEKLRQDTLEAKAAERVKERIDRGEDLAAESRKPGEHPEKLKDIRNIQPESEKS
jgi:predicted ATP-binding protein involved in virulence